MEGPECKSGTEMSTVENYFEADPHLFIDMNNPFTEFCVMVTCML